MIPIPPVRYWFYTAPSHSLYPSYGRTEHPSQGDALSLVEVVRGSLSPEPLVRIPSGMHQTKRKHVLPPSWTNLRALRASA